MNNQLPKGDFSLLLISLHYVINIGLVQAKYK